MWGPAIAVAVGPGAAATAMEAASDNFDVLTLIGSNVTPAIVVVLFLLGKIVPGKVADTAEERADKAEEKLDVLNGLVADKIVPALTRTYDVLDRLAPFIQSELAIRDARASLRPPDTWRT